MQILCAANLFCLSVAVKTRWLSQRVHSPLLKWGLTKSILLQVTNNSSLIISYLNSSYIVNKNLHLILDKIYWEVYSLQFSKKIVMMISNSDLFWFFSFEVCLLPNYQKTSSEYLTLIYRGTLK